MLADARGCRPLRGRGLRMRVQRSGHPDASAHGVPSLPQSRGSVLRGGPGLLL